MTRTPPGHPTLLYQGSEWNFELLNEAYRAIEQIAVGEFGLDVYPNQIEVITSEQMLDAYASLGMPLMYSHWSFGKHFSREEMLYRTGGQSLAYELVINSDPCVCYVMEENTMTMQTLVLAHAAFGHNHFFKNNQLFRRWTRAERVLSDLAYAKQFIAHCEERYGEQAVEKLLDSAHALMSHGVSRYAPRSPAKAEDAHQRAMRRHEHREATYNDLWRTLPAGVGDERVPETAPEDASPLELPEENLLKFLAEKAPRLRDWEREILHIIRRLAQYFYPQRQTKLMNEGCATFVHYEVMNRLFAQGRINEGSMLEFLHMHSAVVTQPDFDERRFGGLNPYALGFAMMRDIHRICTAPDDEDLEWFPEFAGKGDPWDVLRQAWSEYRDESFILQFLSPHLIREMKLFAVVDESEAPFLSVSAIHDESGYREIRRLLARQYDLARREPEIEVTEADMTGSRRLVLTHRVRDGRLLESDDCKRCLRHVASLWGYQVRLVELDVDSGKILASHDVVAMP